MTFDELNKKLGGHESKVDWHQSTGGGWIHNAAKVEDESNVTECAIISGDAWVYGDARVCGNAGVYGNAQVYGDARVYGNAQVYGDAQVCGDTWVKSPLFIIGSKHSLTNARAGHIQIGCLCHTFDWWKEHGLEVAKKEGFTQAEIDEYTAYVELFCKIGK